MRIPSILLCLAFTSAAFAGELFTPYEVVWTTPSRDVHGTMPLGNGEVALNAWIDELGDLRFYLARIDAIDENFDLLKIGAIRVRVGDASETRTQRHFRQRLDVKRGLMEAEFGIGGGKTNLRLWVEPDRPVVVVEVDTTEATEATATAELWRPSGDTVLTALRDEIGWYRRNEDSKSFRENAAIQGLDDFPREDPILHRTFGALLRGEHVVKRFDDKTLQSEKATSHRFEIVVLTEHPATEKEWFESATTILDAARKIDFSERRARRDAWWSEFWNRSWIHISPAQTYQAKTPSGVFPKNDHPIQIGRDQQKGSRFHGSFGRVSFYPNALGTKGISALAASEPTRSVESDALPKALCELFPEEVREIADSADWSFPQGMTFEAWIRPERTDVYQRIVDKITVGGSDGFLFDLTPEKGLRLILGGRTMTFPNTVREKEWSHVVLRIDPAGRPTILLNGKMPDGSEWIEAEPEEPLSDPEILTRAYTLQRYVNACAGRGPYPIKFNGSLFTVPEEEKPGDPDYRRWGSPYWHQNTRLPYLSMPAAGDFDLMQPYFRMYLDLLPLCKFRTKRYFGHEGAYYPETLYFWGEYRQGDYGPKPWNERENKLCDNNYIKREWVGTLEIALMMLEYCEYVGDDDFLREKVLPFTREILTFFDRHYPTGDDGVFVMNPSQSLETWWDCTNPMPEIAGLHAVIDRLARLSETRTGAEQRTFWNALKRKLPKLPTMKSPDGKEMLAPAEKFVNKQNMENPELYAVFPFRNVFYDNLAELGIEALKHRTDKGAFGWRQDDLFMAWLGLADEARDYLLQRAKNKHVKSRFPVFWGPNYDWIPDQDHGGVLNKGVQSLVMQCDGDRIDLLPAWPADWNCEFKLHAPDRTIVEGRWVEGRLEDLKVTPESRKESVRILFKSKNGALQTR